MAQWQAGLFEVPEAGESWVAALPHPERTQLLALCGHGIDNKQSLELGRSWAQQRHLAKWGLTNLPSGSLDHESLFVQVGH